MIEKPRLPKRSLLRSAERNGNCAFQPVHALRKIEIIIASDKEVHVIRHHYVPSNSHPELVATSASVGFKTTECWVQVSNLLTMNCTNRNELQSRIVDLKDLPESRWATLDHDGILAADTAASTPESSYAGWAADS